MSKTADVDPEFWHGRKVLLTGHTGFKGGWAALWLASMGARVTGLALAADEGPSLYELAAVGSDVNSVLIDLRDRAATRRAVENAAPELVLHLAAQPLVRKAAREPVETIATNVMGTVHLLDALRGQEGVKAILVVTSDKVYANDDSGRPFREGDPLGGHEPYGASKAAVEIVSRTYGDAYFEPRGVPLATARGGNVLGGGDFAEDRVVPDIIRAISTGADLVLRHPDATRPWQHVLDCVGGYFCYLQALTHGGVLPRALNFGPGPNQSITVGQLSSAFLSELGSNRAWVHAVSDGPWESRMLSLDSEEARRHLGWRERCNGAEIIALTLAWYRKYFESADMRAFTIAQIGAFMAAGTRAPSFGDVKCN